MAPETSRLHVGGKLSFRRRVPKNGSISVDHPQCVEFSDNPPSLHKLVPPDFQKVEIEVGPGKGAFMLAATAVRPKTFLLGIEAAPSYGLYVGEKLASAGRSNGLMLIDNAKLYLQDRVDDAAVDRLHIYFPDPWPKRRHRKRRFFTTEMADTIFRVIKPGGHLLCATDNAAYAGQICRTMGSSQLKRDEAEEHRLTELGAGHAFGPTNFERKYVNEGRVIRRYVFRRDAESARCSNGT